MWRCVAVVYVSCVVAEVVLAAAPPQSHPSIRYEKFCALDTAAHSGPGATAPVPALVMATGPYAQLVEMLEGMGVESEMAASYPEAIRTFFSSLGENPIFTPVAEAFYTLVGAGGLHLTLVPIPLSPMPNPFPFDGNLADGWTIRLGANDWNRPRTLVDRLAMGLSGYAMMRLQDEWKRGGNHLIQHFREPDLKHWGGFIDDDCRYRPGAIPFLQFLYHHELTVALERFFNPNGVFLLQKRMREGIQQELRALPTEETMARYVGLYNVTRFNYWAVSDDILGSIASALSRYRKMLAPSN